jgi:uncharacterized protein
MDINNFLSRFFHSPISSLGIILLIVLTGSTPAFCGDIHDAAKYGDLAKVKALLKDNPKLVSSKIEYGWTPLHWAAMEGYKNVAKLLLAMGADVNAKDNWGYTPLHIAAQDGTRTWWNYCLPTRL